MPVSGLVGGEIADRWLADVLRRKEWRDDARVKIVLRSDPI